MDYIYVYYIIKGQEPVKSVANILQLMRKGDKVVERSHHLNIDYVEEVFVESPEDGYVSSIQKFECPFETIDVRYIWRSLEGISDFILEHWEIVRQRFSYCLGVFVISTRNSSLWFTSAISGHPLYLKR